MTNSRPEIPPSRHRVYNKVWPANRDSASDLPETGNILIKWSYYFTIPCFTISIMEIA